MFKRLKREKKPKSNSTENHPVTNKKSKQESASDKPDEISVKERPRICLIDVEDDCFQSLKAKGFSCYNGTLGSLIEVPNKNRNDKHPCLLVYDFPSNIHEYDIIIIDLQNPKTIPYLEKDHTHSQVKGKSCTYLLSSFPETIFDPRPLTATILNNSIESLMEKESIIIVFGAAQEGVSYQPVTINQNGTSEGRHEERFLYNFSYNIARSNNAVGTDTTVVYHHGDELGKLLEQHNSKVTYRITFQHPTTWKDDERVKDPKFIPLIEAAPEQIVSYAKFDKKNLTLLFPEIKRKTDFITDLLEKVLPDTKPSLFPFSTQFAWRKEALYRLPNEDRLLQQKNQLRDEYDENLKQIDDKIEKNHLEYEFLHDLLTQTGDALVKTVEKYFNWLEFDDVVNVDETEPELKEEDLRIETEQGLLVIEVKGIGGTSTDPECAQINKIKLRRMEERQAFNVFGLYLVNHQRYLPPEERKNPPFDQKKINDAKLDKRGLLTTYDLFKLYSNVVDGYISKEDARKALFGTGLVRFQPSNAIKIPQPSEIHHNGHIVILNIDDLMLKKDAPVILCQDDKYWSAKIVEIQFDGDTVGEASSGEVGVKLSEKVSKNTELWLLNNE